jgi:hypothetical protein
LVPQFRTFDELLDRISTAISDAFPSSHVEFDYIPEPTGGPLGTPARIEVSVGFAKNVSLEDINLDASAGIGDLADLSVNSSMLSITGFVDFNASFGVLLGPNNNEQLRIISNACEGRGFLCVIPTDIIGVLMVVDKESFGSNLIEYPFTISRSTDEVHIPTKLLEALQSAAPSLVFNVTTMGSTVMALEFSESISEVELMFKANCKDFKNQTNVPEPDIMYFTCPGGFSKRINRTGIVPIGLKDGRISKLPFQVALGGVRPSVDLHDYLCLYPIP